MIDVEGSENGVGCLPQGCLAHSDQLFGKVFIAHSRFPQLNVFEFNQDAVESFDVTLYAFLKGFLGLNTPNNVPIRTLPFSEPTKTLDRWVCF
jgi:hypothetical protein